MRRRLEIKARRPGFDALCLQYNVAIENQVICLVGDKVVASCLWLPNQGKTAVCYIPPPRHLGGKEPYVSKCLKLASTKAAALGMKMIQGIFDTGEPLLDQIYLGAGYRLLAILQFMEHGNHWPAVSAPLASGYALQTYNRDNHDLFKAAIAESYVQTLDCPQMSGLRDLEDVIAGHKAAGPFDPRLWYVLVHQGAGIGVMLLTLQRGAQSLDITYLGLAPRHRGQGRAAYLLSQVGIKLCEMEIRNSALAVDEGNTPAMKLYLKFGYRPVLRRCVYFLPLTDACR